MTVLFADAKDSTALTERLDAEEWHRVLDRFFAILTEGAQAPYSDGRPAAAGARAVAATR